MQLKQDYNFSLESKDYVIKIRKFITIWHLRRYGSIAELIPLVRICVLGSQIGKIANFC